MSRDVLTVDRTTSIQDAAQNMTKSNVGCVIVTENNNPIGIVTERDMVTKVAAEGIPLFSEISGVMSSPLITIDAEETVWEAAEKMKERKIHKLPVLEKEDIVGIITTTDIVRISSVGSDSQMRRVCDQILLRMKHE